MLISVVFGYARFKHTKMVIIDIQCCQDNSTRVEKKNDHNIMTLTTGKHPERLVLKAFCREIR